MSDLYLMCGLPGSGKSTFLKTRIKNIEDCAIISRDEIRFTLVKPEEEYFSHENEIYTKLWKKTNEALTVKKNVFVDQTSLTPKARQWLLSHIHNYDNAYLIWIDEDLNTCLKRNESRKGTRSYVPRSVIRRMAAQFIEPSLDENFTRIYKYNSKENKLLYKNKK